MSCEWVLTQWVFPGLVFLAFVVVTIALLATLADNRRLLSLVQEVSSNSYLLGNPLEARPDSVDIPSNPHRNAISPNPQ